MTPAGALRLKSDEALRLYVYDDKSSKTIEAGPAGGVPTIGYGRNLRDRGITPAEADYLFDNDITTIETLLNGKFPWMNTIPPVWQDVMVMVEYNTGNVGAFVKMLAYMKALNTIGAATEIMDSAAARELVSRYTRMQNAIRTQSWG